MNSDKNQKSSTDFESLGLTAGLCKTATEQEYREPTAVQVESIPPILQGKDILAASKTGSGKTAAFVLPLIQMLDEGKNAGNNQARSLILAPTRELVLQIAEYVRKFSKRHNLNCVAVFGGVKINPQMIRLTRGADMLIATPGRLLDLTRRKAVTFRSLKYLVLDEADRMLNLGFTDEIEAILKLLPAKRQNLLFTATFSEEVRSLAKEIVRNPLELSLDPEEPTPVQVEQWIYSVDHEKKTPFLLDLLRELDWDRALLFCKTKNRADRLVRRLLNEGLKAAAIHGDRSQSQRNRALDEFRSRKISLLVSTDLAARGIDIEQLPLVINVDLPHLKEDYIHRIGRTGRAGRTGQAVSLVDLEEFPKLKDIERLTQQVLERRTLPGFTPEQELPESTLDLRPFKPKKPKKTKKKIEEKEADPSDQDQ